MDSGRRQAVSCPVCSRRIKNLWQHFTLQGADPVHRQAQEAAKDRILVAFATNSRAVAVGMIEHVNHNLIEFLWHEAFGAQATLQRRTRLRIKPKPACARCGGPLKRYAFKFCSPTCANREHSADPQVQEKKSLASKGHPKTAEHCAHISRGLALGLASGSIRRSHGRYKRGWHTSPIAGQQWYDSGWERQRMEFLDSLGVPWTKKHGIRLAYINLRGEARHHVPDFLVDYPEGKVLEEVKGQADKDLDIKINAARAHCQARGWGYVLVTSRAALHKRNS